MHVGILYFLLKQKKKHSGWIPMCSGLPGLWSFEGNYTLHLEKRCYHFYAFSVALKLTLALWKLAFASVCNTQAGTMLTFLHFIPLDFKRKSLCNGHTLFFFFLFFFYKNNRERERHQKQFFISTCLCGKPRCQAFCGDAIHITSVWDVSSAFSVA